MKRTAALLVFLSCSLVCALPGLAQNERGPSLPEFPYADGWLGSDAAYSIPLSATRSLWLFGDTFVSDPGEQTPRSKAKTMVRNSIGLMDCEKKEPCRIAYAWRDPHSEKPRSFFDTGREDEWYWPLDGYRDGNKLYLSLLIVRNKKGSGPTDAFGFEIAGTRWAVIDNLNEAPLRWKIAVKPLTEGPLWAGTSIVPDGKYALFYSQVSEGEGKGYMAVLRVPRNKMRDPAASWEYLGKDRQWHRGTPHGDALTVIDQAISEMSVRYHSSLRKWVAVSGGAEFPTSRAVVRIADSAVGPWSEPKTVLEFPEMKQSNKNYDKDTFCYAVKEHVEYSDAKIVLTYACNSFSLQKVIANMEIYRPQVVVLEVPK